MENKQVTHSKLCYKIQSHRFYLLNIFVAPIIVSNHYQIIKTCIKTNSHQHGFSTTPFSTNCILLPAWSCMDLCFTKSSFFFVCVCVSVTRVHACMCYSQVQVFLILTKNAQVTRPTQSTPQKQLKQIQHKYRIRTQLVRTIFASWKDLIVPMSSQQSLKMNACIQKKIENFKIWHNKILSLFSEVFKKTISKHEHSIVFPFYGSTHQLDAEALTCLRRQLSTMSMCSLHYLILSILQSDTYYST